MIEFQPVETVLDFTAAFEIPAFGLWKDPNAIAAITYRALSPYGLQLAGMEWDWGRNIGENRLRVLGLFSYGASYEIRRDGIYVQFLQLSRELVDEFSRSVEALLVAFKSGEAGTSYGRFRFTLGLHGKLSSANPVTFLRGFLSKVPRGLGEVQESGCAFWFAPTGECPSLSLLIEPSRRIQEALWIRLQGALDARKVSLDAIRPRIETLYSQTLSALDLSLPTEVKGQ